MNKEINRIELPAIDEGPKRVLNSECSFETIKFKIKLILVGTFQYIGIRIAIKIIELTQLREIKIVEAGSNTEKRFVIIFSCLRNFYFYSCY